MSSTVIHNTSTPNPTAISHLCANCNLQTPIGGRAWPRIPPYDGSVTEANPYPNRLALSESLLLHQKLD
eukprot:7024571-Alexandrium_andersonii.AAC.1